MAKRADLRQILQPFDVFLVGVHCTLEELERRERLRGDRRIGEAREHVEVDGVHGFGPYDLEVDTTGQDPSDVARELLERWRARSRSALFSETSL